MNLWSFVWLFWGPFYSSHWLHVLNYSISTRNLPQKPNAFDHLMITFSNGSRVHSFFFCFLVWFQVIVWIIFFIVHKWHLVTAFPIIRNYFSIIDSSERTIINAEEWLKSNHLSNWSRGFFCFLLCKWTHSHS